MLKNFKIIISDIKEAKQVLLILNSYGVSEGLANLNKHMEEVITGNYPCIFYKKDKTVTRSSLTFHARNLEGYGPEYAIKEMLKF